MLNRKYFKTISTENIGNFEYQIIRPTGHPMILFSKVDGTPLAALEVRCQDEQSGKAIIAHRYNGKTDFQAIINEDHQEFEFVISSLVPKGMIKIDIMKNGEKVVDVNPRAAKGGVNQVNELNPFQSYNVRCDQKDNFTFVLDAIKKSDGGNITVKEIESGTSTQVTKYWINVVPQAGQDELVSKFEDTYWSCVDVFILKKQYTMYRGGYHAGEEGGRRGIIEEDYDYEDDDDRYGRITSRSSMSRTFEGRMDESSRGYETYQMSLDSYPTRGLTLLSSAASPRFQDHAGEESNMHVQYSARGSDSRDTSRGPVIKKMSATTMLSGNRQSIIDDSSAAAVRQGRKISVNSHETGITYVFDKHSPSCTIGLSVVEGLEFDDRISDSDLVTIGKDMIQYYVKDEYKLYLDKLPKVYATDDCVVCLEGTPNSVMYSCGHQCCHYECAKTITKCPMCRKCITAKIQC